MKNSEIHNGLDKREMRDFISISFAKNFDSETSLEKPKTPYDKENPIVWSIKDKENEIELHKKHLQLLKEKQALIEIMKMHGWREFDVSDETIKDLSYKLHLNFVGTEEEHESLLESIEN